MTTRFSMLLLLTGVIALSGCGASTVPPSVTPNLTKVAEIREQLASATSVVEEETTIEFNNQFATLKGVIKLDGQAPANPTLNVNKDLSVCKPGGANVLNEIVVVGSGNGLANVLLFATVPKEWCHESMVGNTDTVEFDQKNCLFLNRVFPMQTTQTLKILNSDSVGHNAALSPSKNTPDNPGIPGGGHYIYPPGGGELRQEKSPFPVSCSAHPWMQSFMIFRENGYFAVTADDGSFELPNLPAGVPVVINVWHEATKGVPGKEVTVQPEGIAEGWGRRGSFTVNLEPDSQAELQIAINSSALSK